MNFRKLLTYLTVSTAAVIPFAGAQNPTILQGSYISNVFGNSNFVLNPNAQTNVANVTNATRSIATPLVATSEFNLNLTSGTFATWTLRAFDAGMKGQNCEARFSYRGFATATSTAQIVQNSLVVAQLVLTPSTDPRIASINFPCGDLANATTFRIAQTTANMTTVTPNEIGGIYVGLATNMANVAQAEFVGGGEWTTSTGFTRSSSAIQSTFAAFTSGAAGTALGKATSAGSDTTITFPYLPAGQYNVSANLYNYLYIGGVTNANCEFTLQEIDSNTNSGVISTGAYSITTIYPPAGQLQGNFSFTTGGQRRFRIVSRNTIANGASSLCVSIPDAAVKAGIYVYRFPSSSELVVTPERQNTFAAASWTGNAQFSRSNTTEFTISDGVFATNRTAFGKAEFTTTANDVAIKVPQMPPGTYKIELTAENMRVQQTSAGTLDANCKWYLKDGTNTASAQSVLYGIQFAIEAVSTATQIVKYTSLADRTFTASAQSATTNATACAINAPKIIITPLDQPSNSALYVEGPVKAAATGAAISSGYVGEEIKNASAVSAVGTTTVNTEVDVPNATITLTPGVWELQYTASLGIERGGWANTVIARARITDSANTVESGTESTVYLANANAVVAGIYSQQTITKRINLTASKTFKLRLTCSESSSVAICYVTNGNITGSITGDDATTYIRAVRIN